MDHDVLIVGGGPAGLASALTLGRARKRVLLCDAGPPRNAAAVHVHNFVTRDGITPAEFRAVARDQLRAYSHVQVRDDRVDEIEGGRDAFRVRTAAGDTTARRLLLCTGMVDEIPAIDGMRELWGTSVFQCPYCHGWEVRDQRFGYLATTVAALEFGLFLRGWTRDVTVFTEGTFAVPPDVAARLVAGNVRVEERPLGRLAATGDRLEAVLLADGGAIPMDVLFVHPVQRQTGLVQSLGLALDEKGFVQLDDHGETSIPGIYAAGDLTTPLQAAVLAAAAGTRAAALLNHDLTCEMATRGSLD
jgi:thioredoxin reductase